METGKMILRHPQLTDLAMLPDPEHVTCMFVKVVWLSCLRLTRRLTAWNMQEMCRVDIFLDRIYCVEMHLFEIFYIFERGVDHPTRSRQKRSILFPFLFRHIFYHSESALPIPSRSFSITSSLFLPSSLHHIIHFNVQTPHFPKHFEIMTAAPDCTAFWVSLLPSEFDERSENILRKFEHDGWSDSDD